jgi:hypothetical protein
VNKDNLKTVRLTDEEKAALVSALINNDVSPAQAVEFDLTDRRRLTAIRRAARDGFYNEGSFSLAFQLRNRL